MAKPMKLETGATTSTHTTVKQDVMLGIYDKGRLGHVERYGNLKMANVAGRAYEQLGFQVMIRCGVSSLPAVYPYGANE